MILLLSLIMFSIFNLQVFSNKPTLVEYKQDEFGNYYALVGRGDLTNAKKIDICCSERIDTINIAPEIYRGANSTCLYNLLIRPLEAFLHKNVLFKPVGKINFINMAALVDNRGVRCCDKYILRRVSSFNGYISSETVDFNEAKVILFGGMVYDALPERMYENCWWIYEEYPGGVAGISQSAYSRFGSERLYYKSEVLKRYVRNIPGWDMKHMSFGTTENGTRAGYDQLQYSRGEIKFIYSLKNFNIERFTGDTALEETFKIRTLWDGPIILHISTHSFTIDASESPFINYYSAKQLAYKTSGLLFTGAAHTLEGQKMPYGMNDGMLYAEEISHYDFSRVDLLVLSACGTALGTVTNDGVLGIQSAFKEAGANTIVSTLWSINDRAAAEFMKVFYIYMSEGYTKYESFEKARDFMIDSEDFNDPLYWAPFIMLD